MYGPICTPLEQMRYFFLVMSYDVLKITHPGATSSFFSIDRYVDTLVQDCSNSIPNALELLQYCTVYRCVALCRVALSRVIYTQNDFPHVLFRSAYMIPAYIKHTNVESVV